MHERAHVGTRGNEVADALAKRGTECGNDDGVCEHEPTPETRSLGRAGSIELATLQTAPAHPVTPGRPAAPEARAKLLHLIIQGGVVLPVA